jgi:hypothetical protein
MIDFLRLSEAGVWPVSVEMPPSISRSVPTSKNRTIPWLCGFVVTAFATF